MSFPTQVAFVGISFLVIFFLMIFGVLYASREEASTFASACLEVKGKPVHDGRQWVCLKEEK